MSVFKAQRDIYNNVLNNIRDLLAHIVCSQSVEYLQTHTDI